MTIICAMLDGKENGCWIASDRQVSGGSQSIVGYQDKWVIGDGLAIGISGYSCLIDDFTERVNEFKPDMTASRLWKCITGIMQDSGWKPKQEDGTPPWFDAGILFAAKNRLYSLSGSGGGVPFGWGEFASRGSGAELADGAMHALLRHADLRMTTGEMMTACIEAAIAYDTGCGGNPFLAFVS